jgi:Zn-dependent protease with chaperone function
MPAVMNFFQHQEKARQNTTLLVFLFGVAVAGIIVAAYAAIALTWLLLMQHGRQPYMPAGADLWEPRLFAAVFCAVLLIVGFGTIAKIVQLRSGGRAVAESVGGRIIDANLASGQERKALNVVEEMAIASGIPVPPVYILEEQGINAFAAGYTPQDAVVAVTRGSVERLTRDELQGVMGHEFSHIFNGDMRLNIDLVGVLNGILVIGLIGWFVFRTILRSGSRRSSRRGKGGGGAVLLLLLLGLALMVIGYVGTFFGNLIKAAVSRQREFLADASAVQFTRNPSGIAGALKKIGGFIGGSRIEHEGAAALSHMFFCEAEASWLDVLLATHPSLERRIRRIDPEWDGKFVASRPLEAEAVPPRAGLAITAEAAAAGLRAPAVAAARAGVADSVGRLSKPHLDHAAVLIEQLPESVKAAAREPFAAGVLVYAMLIDEEAEPRARQMAYLREGPWPGAAAETERLLADVRGMDDRHRLPAIDLAMPAMRRLSQSQYVEFRDTVESLVRADNRIKLFEWMVQKLVLANLAPQYSGAGRPRVQYYGLGQLGPQCSLLLSTLAYMGQRDPAAAQAAFEAGARCLGKFASSLRMVEAEACKFGTLEAALDELKQVAPRLKQQLVEACSATVLADGRVTVQEAELLRGILAILGCPMPPAMDVE